MYNRDLLKYHMGLKGKARKDCANALSMCYNTFNSYYNGNKAWNIEDVQSLCSYLEINDNDLKCAIFLS